MNVLNHRVAAALSVAIFSMAAFMVAQPQAASRSSDATDPSFPAWAYPWNPTAKLQRGDTAPRRVPDSVATFSMADAQNLYFSPDWHPDASRPMPEIVARGRKPDVQACGSCHRAEGMGGPENARLAGLPAAYIVQQISDFKSGARKASGPLRGPVRNMLANAKALTDAEIQAAAQYFSELKPKSVIEVVETDTVPKAFLARNHYVDAKSGEKEPIGQRIVELPLDVERFELRDSRARFIAYVPKGALAKGETLAKTGSGGKTVPCASCHGPDMKGLGPIPSIAGRSPSYIVRQLYDFKHGTRAGPLSAAMKPSVEKLSVEDFISLAAYLASLAP